MLVYLKLLDTPEEKEVFRMLYEQYAQKMYHVAFRIMGDGSLAEDMVHETFLTLTKHMDKLKDVSGRRTWNYILTALKHQCFDALEKEKKTVSLWDEEMIWVAEEEEIEGRIIDKERDRQLNSLIHKMRYPYKEVLYLRYYNECKPGEIADLLQLKPEYVRQIAKRAKEQLKKKMKEMGYEL